MKNVSKQAVCLNGLSIGDITIKTVYDAIKVVRSIHTYTIE